MTTCNTCRRKSVKDRNSIKPNLYQAEVHLKCNYLNHVESQYIQLSNKARYSTIAVPLHETYLDVMRGLSN